MALQNLSKILDQYEEQFEGCASLTTLRYSKVYRSIIGL